MPLLWRVRLPEVWLAHRCVDSLGEHTLIHTEPGPGLEPKSVRVIWTQSGPAAVQHCTPQKKIKAGSELDSSSLGPPLI